MNRSAFQHILLQGTRRAVVRSLIPIERSLADKDLTKALSRSLMRITGSLSHHAFFRDLICDHSALRCAVTQATKDVAGRAP